MKKATCSLALSILLGNTRPVAGLHVLKGESHFTVGVALGDEQADLQAAEKLARKILAKL